MNYENIYNALVEKAKPRGLDKSQHSGYFEIHHIIPKCLGGSNDKDNLVMFTAREHFIAHLLLWKAFPEEDSLMRAAMLMSSFWRDSFGGVGVRTSARLYETLRKEYALAVSVQVSGEGNPFFGKTHTQEALAKTRAWYAANPEHHLKVMAYKRGITLEEAREIKQARLDKKARIKFNKENGIKRELTDSQRAALLKANTGRVVSEETKQRMVEGFKALEKQPWDTYNVRTQPEIIQRWLFADIIRNMWNTNGSVGHKFFTSYYNELLGDTLPSGSLKSMVEKFSDGWIPQNDSKWLSFKESIDKDLDYEKKLKAFEFISLNDIRSIYLSTWVSDRESHRTKISKILEELKIEQHKNNSKSSLSLVDVAEANVLYSSGLVSKKILSKMFDVRANTLSQFTSPNLRFREITDNLDTILSSFYQAA